MRPGLPHLFVLKRYCRWVAAAIALLARGSSHQERPRAPYVPLAELEAVYGPLIMAGNHPTSDQSGTGDRLGLFRDAGERSGGYRWSLQPTVPCWVVLRPQCAMHRSPILILQAQPLSVPRTSQLAGAVVLAS